jgi:hypothetical protein
MVLFQKETTTSITNEKRTIPQNQRKPTLNLPPTSRSKQKIDPKLIYAPFVILARIRFSCSFGPTSAPWIELPPQLFFAPLV